MEILVSVLFVAFFLGALRFTAALRLPPLWTISVALAAAFVIPNLIVRVISSWWARITESGLLGGIVFLLLLTVLCTLALFMWRRGPFNNDRFGPW